ncbi:tyrosine-type recombinase/integrase [Streptomyces sp. NPDC007971]|uniref:tyrosine-type recombinase/integrase n=1 Tax=Streptomyces sp. NPDC007971 TaxID=3364799 RepID=UPI0036E89C79
MAPPKHACSIATRFRPHTVSADTSHTYVTRLIEAGYDASFVTEQVGHSHAATTAIYTALSSDYKNSQVREFLDAAEQEALRSVFARAEAEADMDDEFDTGDGEPTPVGGRGGSR